MPIRTMPVYNLDASVGQGGGNRTADVRLVQTMLLELAKVHGGWQPAVPLVASGVPSPALVAWIIAFQKETAKKNPGRIVIDGRVDPMKMTTANDYSSGFGYAYSTMYALNWALHHYAKQVHEGLGARLGIPDA